MRKLKYFNTTSLFGEKLPSWFHNKTFHQNMWYMRKWESTVFWSNAFLYNAIILFISRYKFLSCCVIYFNWQILPLQKWIHNFAIFIIAADLGDIKNTSFENFQQFFHTKFLHGRNWFRDIFRGPVIKFRESLDKNFKEFTVNSPIDTVRSCCIYINSLVISNIVLITDIGLLLVVFPLIYQALVP